MADFALRAATEGDRAAVLRLLAASLGWEDDERFASFYAWKHEQSPFGRSTGLVAVDGDRVVGFRTFLRWEFVDASGTRRRAVRAVDTATHPDHQGRGIFRALTLRAVEELTAEGLDFVFNTPNDRSRPGYLTMGWVEVGRLPTSVRFSSPGAVVRMARSRVPAERWPAAPSGGLPASDVLTAPGVAALLDSLGPPAGLRTARTPEFLRWRYGYAPLGYRVVTASSRVEDGLAVFRVRRRGRALEGALCEVLVPSGAADRRGPWCARGRHRGGGRLSDPHRGPGVGTQRLRAGPRAGADAHLAPTRPGCAGRRGGGLGSRSRRRRAVLNGPRDAERVPGGAGTMHKQVM